MWKKIREFLGYNKSERRGTASLLFLIVIFIAADLMMPQFLRPYLKRLDKKKAMEMQVLLAKVERSERMADQSFNQLKIALKGFNPNLATAVELSGLGFSDVQVRMILGYRGKGGSFRIRSDLKKIYSISESDYHRYEAYIELPKKFDKEKSQQKKENIQRMIEINSADSADLVSLKGIGPVFAKRIIGYRNLLGGYARKEQLLEIYGMKEEYYKMACQGIIIDTTLIKPLKLMSDDFKVLLKHPYLDYETTRIIFQARKNENINTNKELLNYLVNELDSELIKLAPYLHLPSTVD